MCMHCFQETIGRKFDWKRVFVGKKKEESSWDQTVNP